MAEPTLTELFGASATFSGGVFSFRPDEIGISSTFNAEQLFAAILTRMQTVQDETPSYQVRVFQPSLEIIKRNNKTFVAYDYKVQFLFDANDLPIEKL